MGLFKKRTSGSHSPVPKPAVEETVAFQSQTAQRIGQSVSSTQSQAQPRPRRNPMPRQKTVEYVTPPPIEEGEVEIFESQIADLSRCVEDKTLFDFLISDIDRNRLTQIALILADRGEYPRMARVLEMTESLDRLIASRIEENHQSQGHSLQRTFSDVLRDADDVLADTSLPIETLRGKIREFDHDFLAFQNEAFDSVLLLAQKITEIRKRVTEETPNHPSSPPSLNEPWVQFPVSHSPNKEIEDVHIAELGLVASAAEGHSNAQEEENIILSATSRTEPELPSNRVDVLSAPDAAEAVGGVSEPDATELVSKALDFNEPKDISSAAAEELVGINQIENGDIFATPSSNQQVELKAQSEVQCTVERESNAGAEALAEMQKRFMRRITLNWHQISDLTTRRKLLSSSLYSKLLVRIITYWRIGGYVSSVSRDRSSSRAREALREWSNCCKRLRDLRSWILDRNFRHILQCCLLSWRSYCVDTSNRLLEMSKKHQESIGLSLLRNWWTLARSEGHLRRTADTLEAGVRLSSMLSCLIAWFRLHHVVQSEHLLYARCIRDWQRIVLRTRQVRNRNESLRIAYATLARWREKKREQQDNRPDEVNDCWEADEQLAADDPIVDQSSISLPSTVEYYVIHDEPTVDDLTFIKHQTDAVISRAQIFISQHRLVEYTSSTAERPFIPAPKARSMQDVGFFRSFDLKWCAEQAKWRL